MQEPNGVLTQSDAAGNIDHLLVANCAFHWKCRAEIIINPLVLDANEPPIPSMGNIGNLQFHTLHPIPSSDHDDPNAADDSLDFLAAVINDD